MSTLSLQEYKYEFIIIGRDEEWKKNWKETRPDQTRQREVGVGAGAIQDDDDNSRGENA